MSGPAAPRTTGLVAGAQVRRRFSNPRFAGLPFKEVLDGHFEERQNFRIGAPSLCADLRRTTRFSPWTFSYGNFPHLSLSLLTGFIPVGQYKRYGVVYIIEASSGKENVGRLAGEAVGRWDDEPRRREGAI